MVNKGIIAVDIARTLNMEKSHVFYYISKAKKLGYIKQVTRDAFVVLELTQSGKNFLDQYTQNNPSIPIIRLENIQFKAKVLQMPTIPVDWKKIEMQNWTQYNTQVDSIRVKLNLGNPPTLLLIPSPIDGGNLYDLLITVVYECVNSILELHSRTGLRVDKLQPCSRPEWLVYDPVAKSFCKNNGHGQITYEGIGKVNASLPRHIGEFEFHDPRALVDYLAMPKRVQNIEAMLTKVLSQRNQKYDGET